MKDTIAAIATPSGQGAIAIIRISGPLSKNILKNIFSKKNLQNPVPRKIYFGNIVNKNKTPIDSVLVHFMKGPHSYTGEDTLEIHCHGGSFICKKILQRVLENGARIANPGEFTYRAFMNNKMDLTQAEAVQKIISSKNDQALKAANNQLNGHLFKKISSFQKDLVNTVAQMEAFIDFPTEDIEIDTKNRLLKTLQNLYQEMVQLKNTYKEGSILFEGISIGILGSTNVGKSTLMNLLCKKNKSIVTDIPGTTRDPIEQEILLQNLHCKLIDTAGIRDTEKKIEAIGIKKSKEILQSCDIILLLLDATKGIQKEEKNLLKKIKDRKKIIVWNKIDLKKPEKTSFRTISISAKKNMGIDSLKTAAENLILKNSSSEIVLTSKRHQEALVFSIDFLKKAIKDLEKDFFYECVIENLQSCLNYLKNIIGHDVKEDILSKIFSKFCIGK